VIRLRETSDVRSGRETLRNHSIRRVHRSRISDRPAESRRRSRGGSRRAGRSEFRVENAVVPGRLRMRAKGLLFCTYIRTETGAKKGNSSKRHFHVVRPAYGPAVTRESGYHILSKACGAAYRRSCSRYCPSVSLPHRTSEAAIPGVRAVAVKLNYCFISGKRRLAAVCVGGRP
jgi:hypothetical protein